MTYNESLVIPILVEVPEINILYRILSKLHNKHEVNKLSQLTGDIVV